MNPNEHNVRLRTERQLTLRVAAIACIVSCLLVALDLWDNRDLFDPEGVSYLDIADAYRRGDWRAALVSSWSPFYSWLLALMMLLFDPSPKWEFTAVHALNFFIYLVTLASFSVFMWRFLKTGSETAVNERLPDWAWLALGYSLFTWSIVRLIPAHQPEPDLFVCALVYLIFAMLFRIRRGALTWVDAIFFGVLLAFGYFSKGIMFPMAFVFTGVALILARRHSQGQTKILVAFSVFLLLSMPYVVVLSNAHGRLMFNDAGRLNYVWQINQVKGFNHWQGEDGVHGTPVHPTRKIYDDPPMYEFATPFEVTYPPWYDPSYWYEGVKPTVDLRRQLSVFIGNTKVLLSFLANSTGPVNVRFVNWGALDGNVETTIGSLLTLFCVIAVATRRRVSVFRRLTEHWFVLIPIGAVLGAYALLHFEGRYVAAYVVILWMVLFRSVTIPHSEESKRLLSAVLACAALISAITLSAGAGRAMLHAGRYLVNGNGKPPFFQSGYSNWKVVEYLHNAGVRAGERVGAVGWTYSAYWARMARVHIVAEIPAEGATAFWLSDLSKRAAIMQLFRSVGAKAVVAKSGHMNAQGKFEWDLRGLPGKPAPLPVSASNSTVSVGSAPANWQHIADTDYYVYVF
jgi:hypothetical protein